MTDTTTTTPAHSSETIRHLAKAIGGLTTTIRAVGAGRELHEPFTLEPIGWTSEALADFDRLSKASREVTAEEGGAPALPREAVSHLAFVADTAAQALESLASGAGVADALRYAIMADSHLAQFVRMIPEDEYMAAVRDAWGREALPARLR